ncbi:hypothetical protein [Labilibaculum euxinus]|uniref:Uncharacterized protein n=1 Tax=Labilibaculum euxinus TaxID=2686357 RepID=A0A7M4D7B7_9BACT|nr:hypothetical protein [Labilibaculum euxinus]MUP38546.1 hypothetical protein [Labilibaculum euxinus]MVB07751.1 hypothetical protein [Labilibaculum euxinus]
MIKLLLSPLLIYFISIPVFSQESSVWKGYPNLGIMHYKVILDDVPEEQNNYQNPQFELSKLTTTENKVLNSIKIRYNVKTDVMECRIGSQHSTIKSPEKLKEVNINGKCFEYKKYLVKRDTTSGYLQKLYGCGQKIYAKYYIPSTKSKLDLKKTKSYYLIQNKGELPKKLNSPSALLSRLYKNLIKQANEFEKNNQLNLKNPADFEKLLTYLNHLSKDIVASR